jgi:hypothetical protein
MKLIHAIMMAVLAISFTACGFDTYQEDNSNTKAVENRDANYYFASIEKLTFRNNYLTVQGDTTAASQNSKHGICNDMVNGQCGFILGVPMEESAGQTCIYYYSLFRKDPTGLIFVVKEQYRCALIVAK